MKNKRQRKVYLYLLVVLGLTIGFALLSTTLKINGTASIKSNTWDVHWDESSIAVTTGSVTATDPSVTTTTSTDDTLSFDVDLTLPGDFYEFTIDAENAGSIDAALDTITTKIYDDNNQELTGNNIPSYLIYSVKYGDGSTPTSGNILEHGQSQTYKIRVAIDEEADGEDLPDTNIDYHIEVTIPYVQHKSETPVEQGPVTVSATKTTAQVGETVKVTVTATDVAAWNLHLTGAIIDDSFVGVNMEGTNTTTSHEFTLDTSTAGEKVINITGDVTDENNVKTNINKSITITIQ